MFVCKSALAGAACVIGIADVAKTIANNIADNFFFILLSPF